MDTVSASTSGLRTVRLLAFARELQRASTFSDLLVATQAEVASVVGYAHAWLFVADRDDGLEWRLLDIVGARREDSWRVAPVLSVANDPMLAEIAEGNAPVVVVDARVDPRTNKRIVEQLGNRTIVNVPLRLLDNPLGCFGTGTFGDEEGCRPPNEDQLDYLVGMASQLSVAVGRIRFLEERKLAEEARRRSETDLAILLDSIGDGVIAVDADGLVTRLNPVASEILEWSASDAVGHRLTEVFRIVDERSRAPLEDPFARIVRERALVRRGEDVVLTRRGGGTIPIAYSASPMRSPEGAVRGAVVTFRDVTERKRAAEAELFRRAKEAAEEANNELEAFSYSVAHDLRSPLRGIGGFSATLLEDYAERLDEEAIRRLRRIIAGVSRMAEIIDALLSLARLTRTEPRRGLVSLTDLARSVIEQLRVDDPARNVDVVIEEGLVVVGDASLLRVMLENLLGNAWKFTIGRPVARIEVGRAEEGYFVRDNGAGFEMAHAGNIFAPFRRLHAASEFDGLGIGLATVLRVVRRHGGRVWAHGVVDEGATFYFTVPGRIAERASFIERE